MLSEVREEREYRSIRSNILFKVKFLARHGQDCSQSMVVYVNLEETEDSKVGTVWVLSESLFLKRFKEKYDA